MAGGHSDYHRGSMPIQGQKETFDGFMNWTVYGGAFLVVLLLFPILAICSSFGWLPSLIATLLVGILIGLGLKLKGVWYASIVILAIITGLLCALFSAFI